MIDRLGVSGACAALALLASVSCGSAKDDTPSGSPIPGLEAGIVAAVEDAGAVEAGQPRRDNRAPVVANGTLEVESGQLAVGQMRASDPDGDAVTFALTKNPAQGTLTSFDPTTGLFTYRPTAAGGSDSFSFRANDGRSSSEGEGNVAVTITPFTILRTWIISNVTKDGLACADSQVTFSRSGDVLTVSSRSYVCGSSTKTISATTYDIVGERLFKDGVEVGTLTASSLSITLSFSVTGCGSVRSVIKATPTADDLAFEDAVTTSATCLPYSATGTLRRGARLAFVSDGDFGRLRSPGPYERTLHLVNNGDQAATGIAPSALAAPFRFKGGTAPGTGGTCGATLSPGASCAYVVSLGNITGTFDATMNVGYRGGPVTTASLPLSAELYRPASLTFTPAAAEFGVRDRTTLPSTLDVTVRNDGTLAATNLGATLSGDAFGFTGNGYPGANGTCGPTLEGGATCTIELAFRARPKGKYAANVVFAYDDGEANGSASLAVGGTAANFVAYGLLRQWSVSGSRDIVPYYDLGGWGPKVTTAAANLEELSFDPVGDVFYGTNRHTAVHRITRAGTVTNVTPGISWPGAAAVDTSRNRLVVLGRGAYATLALPGTTWATASLPSTLSPETMKYRASDDTLFALNTYYFREATGSLVSIAPATLTPSAPAAIDFSDVKNVYFDEYSDNTHAISADANGKIFIVGQAPWWRTGADASGAFNTYKTAGYELDPVTRKLSLVWEVPENAVQPESATGLYGIGVYTGGCPSAPCPVNVTVNTGIETVLLLSSNDPVTWNLSVSPGTTLTKVLVRSSAAATVVNAGAAVVDNVSGTLHAYTNGTAATQLRYRIENVTKLPMRSFQTAYQQASFTVTR